LTENASYASLTHERNNKSVTYYSLVMSMAFERSESGGGGGHFRLRSHDNIVGAILAETRSLIA